MRELNDKAVSRSFQRIDIMYMKTVIRDYLKQTFKIYETFLNEFVKEITHKEMNDDNL